MRKAKKVKARKQIIRNVKKIDSDGRVRFENKFDVLKRNIIKLFK